jgi:hypothetical protein
VREERVVLEHEPDASTMRRRAGEIGAVEENASHVGGLQARDDP